MGVVHACADGEVVEDVEVSGMAIDGFVAEHVGIELNEMSVSVEGWMNDQRRWLTLMIGREMVVLGSEPL